jgi:hypothetical protein
MSSFNPEDRQNALLRLQQDLALSKKAEIPRKELAIKVVTEVLRSQAFEALKVASKGGGVQNSGKANFWVVINGALAKYSFDATFLETST